MNRVTGIGGIFFKAKDPDALGAWYRDHLGLAVADWGGAIFNWGGPGSEKGMTIWSLFKSVGSCAVIAGSGVTRNVPEGVLAVGNPCRVIREITEWPDDGAGARRANACMHSG